MDPMVRVLGAKRFRIILPCIPIKRAVAPYSSSSKSDMGAFLRTGSMAFGALLESGSLHCQIAAMNTAFARGRMVKVSVNAIRGQTVMLTKSGH